MEQTTMNDLPPVLAMSAGELAIAFGSGDLSPVEVTREALARIRDVDGALNAFCLVDDESSVAQATAAAQRFASGAPRGPLDGVPVAVKDLLLTRGWPTLRGSRLVKPDQRWDVDAPVVERLRAAGCVLIGKTTTPEFGWKAVTDSPLTGVTRNPWDATLTPGGSSGGSTVAVATGMAPLAIGTDGGGSIRIPSSFTGVVGLKPTFGRVPQSPPSPFGVVSHVGPHARSARDAATLLDVIAGQSPEDPFSIAGALHAEPADAGLRGLRVAYSRTLGYAEVDQDVQARVDEAVELLAGSGAEVVEIDPGFADPLPTFEVLWFSGAARVLEANPAMGSVEVDAGLEDFADRGRRLSAATYVAALEARAALAASVDAFLSEFDVLATPAVAVEPFEVGSLTPRSWAGDWMSWTPFTYPFNLSGNPAAVVPCGLSRRRRLPVGLQLVGRRFADRFVLAVAEAYEAVRGPFPAPPSL